MVKYWELSNNIKIKKGCDRSKPCEHLVFIGSRVRWLYGIEIYELCRWEKIIPPEHFLQYANYFEGLSTYQKQESLCHIL